MSTRFLKAAINKIPTAYRYKQGSKKNIMIFANRRGGSSIMAQLLSADSTIRDIDQPFDINDKNNLQSQLKREILPPKLHSQFVSLDPEETEIVSAYVKDLLSGKLPELGYYLYAKRTVLKIVNASPLMDFLGSTFNVEVIYLVRHPVSQSLSVTRNNWEITAEAYLKDERFAHKYLTEEQLAEGYRILSSGSYLEQAILNWCLENLVPLQHSEIKKFTITYEELVMQPEKILKDLNERFVIGSVDKLSNVINKPSRSRAYSDRITLDSIKSGNKVNLVNKWVDQITNEEKEQVQSILDTFNVDHYSAFKIFPNDKLLHYPLFLDEKVTD